MQGVNEGRALGGVMGPFQATHHHLLGVQRQFAQVAQRDRQAGPFPHGLRVFELLLEDGQHRFLNPSFHRRLLHAILEAGQGFVARLLALVGKRSAAGFGHGRRCDVHLHRDPGRAPMGIGALVNGGQIIARLPRRLVVFAQRLAVDFVGLGESKFGLIDVAFVAVEQADLVPTLGDPRAAPPVVFQLGVRRHRRVIAGRRQGRLDVSVRLAFLNLLLQLVETAEDQLHVGGLLRHFARAVTGHGHGVAAGLDARRRLRIARVARVRPE